MYSVTETSLQRSLKNASKGGKERKYHLINIFVIYRLFNQTDWCPRFCFIFLFAGTALKPEHTSSFQGSSAGGGERLFPGRILSFLRADAPDGLSEAPCQPWSVGIEHLMPLPITPRLGIRLFACVTWAGSRAASA